MTTLPATTLFLSFCLDLFFVFLFRVCAVRRLREGRACRVFMSRRRVQTRRRWQVGSMRMNHTRRRRCRFFFSRRSSSCRVLFFFICNSFLFLRISLIDSTSFLLRLLTLRDPRLYDLLSFFDNDTHTHT